MLYVKLIINLLVGYLLSGAHVHAAYYDEFEINHQLNQTKLKELSTNYLQNYFSSSQPKAVIEDLFKANLTPLEREFILFNLLSEISLQAPQNYHQDLIDQMKSYPIQATRSAEEGHLPVVVFNLNSKAHGIENIWTAYRTEQNFNQWFIKDMPSALSNVELILAEPSSQRRPKWLGIKNSIASLPQNSLDLLADSLSAIKSTHTKLDPLISHVGLFSGRLDLINKALASPHTDIRELTLRQIPVHFPELTAKTMLLQQAKTGLDRKFSTSILSHFSHDKKIESFLLKQLANQETAANAAFALSQSNSTTLPNLLRKQYLMSQNKSEKNHLLLALKLNNSTASKLALDDLLIHIEKNSGADKWLKSFKNQAPGEQP